MLQKIVNFLIKFYTVSTYYSKEGRCDVHYTCGVANRWQSSTTTQVQPHDTHSMPEHAQHTHTQTHAGIPNQSSCMSHAGIKALVVNCNLRTA